MLDLFTLIQQKIPSLTNTEQKVANYILNNSQQVRTQTISKIALDSNTSVAAVQRLCKSLGFKGFKEFSFTLENYLKSSSQPSFTNNKLTKYLDSYGETIKQVKEIKKDSFSSLIQAINSAKRIYLWGSYLSSVPMRMLKMGLIDQKYNVVAESDIVSLNHWLAQSDKTDCIIIFSISGKDKETSNIIPSYISNMPPNSFLITQNSDADLKDKFLKTIILPGKNLSDKSIINIQSINVLFVELLLNQLYEQTTQA